jgi:transposase
MSRVNTPTLTEAAKAELENRFRTDPSHTVRMRCQLILLKAQGRPSKEVALIVNTCEMTVNNWVNRYKSEGINGLLTKPGRGRKAIISTPDEQQAALTAIQADRQRLQSAKANWETQTGKTISRGAFRSFLKSVVAVTNASANE